MFSKAINFNTYKSCEYIYRERWEDWARKKRCISVLFLHCWRRKLVSRFTRPTFSLLPDSSLQASHRQNARLLNTYIMFKCYFQQQDVPYGGKYFNAVSKHCNASGRRWNSSVPWAKRWALGTRFQLDYSLVTATTTPHDLISIFQGLNTSCLNIILLYASRNRSF